jgi:hypothetical protein
MAARNGIPIAVFLLDVPQSSSASTIMRFTGNSGPTTGSFAWTYPHHYHTRKKHARASVHADSVRLAVLERPAPD